MRPAGCSTRRPSAADDGLLVWAAELDRVRLWALEDCRPMSWFGGSATGARGPLLDLSSQSYQDCCGNSATDCGGRPVFLGLESHGGERKARHEVSLLRTGPLSCAARGR